MSEAEFPEWMDRTGVNAVGILTLAHGEQMTVEITSYDEDRRVLVVNVIASGHRHSKAGQTGRSIPIDNIQDFHPEERATQPWPQSDPCRGGPFSGTRFGLMSAIFLSMIAGGISLPALLKNEPYGLQTATVVVYTLCVVFFTFAKHGSRSGPDLPPYKFTCPAVQPQLPRLAFRHINFLLALLLLEMVAPDVRRRLPDWWNVPDSKGSTPFELSLLFACLALAIAEIFTNRALLKRAHEEYSG